MWPLLQQVVLARSSSFKVHRATLHVCMNSRGLNREPELSTLRLRPSIFKRLNAGSTTKKSNDQVDGCGFASGLRDSFGCSKTPSPSRISLLFKKRQTRQRPRTRECCILCSGFVISFYSRHISRPTTHPLKFPNLPVPKDPPNLLKL